MNFKERIYRLNFFSGYVYLVSGLMLAQVIVYRLNEQFNWVIRKHLFKILPQSLHQTYLSFVFFLLMFSIVNVFLTPIIGAAVAIRTKRILIVVISLLSAAAYFLLLWELGDGII
jgi:hypothetical protein